MRVLCVLVAVGLVACANPPQPNHEVLAPARIQSPSGQWLCAVHRVPLVTVRGWKKDAGVITLEEPIGRESIEFSHEHPNRIFAGESLYRTKEYNVPTEITYCRVCQKDYDFGGY